MKGCSWLKRTEIATFCSEESLNAFNTRNDNPEKFPMSKYEVTSLIFSANGTIFHVFWHTIRDTVSKTRRALAETYQFNLEIARHAPWNRAVAR